MSPKWIETFSGGVCSIGSKKKKKKSELGPVKMRHQGDVGHLNELLLEKVGK